MAKTDPLTDLFTGIPARAVILDTETTGFTPDGGHRIVEVAALEMIGGKATGRTFHAYVNPGRSVPAQSAAVHGLTTAFLKQFPGFRMIAAELADFLGDAGTEIWAHNASFDERFLRAELGRTGHSLPQAVRCSLKLARRLFPKPELTDHQLATLADRAGHRWTGRAHSALADVETLAAVLETLIWPQAAKAAETSAARTAVPGSSQARLALRPGPSRPSGIVSGPGSRPAMTPRTAAEDARIRRYDGDFTPLLHARGQRWTPDEEGRLLDGFLVESLGIEDLVRRHGRSPAALFLKLEALGAVATGHPYARAR